MPQQRVMEPAPMKEVEKTNVVVMRNQEQGQRMGLQRRDPYAMEVNRERNYYACRRFGHMAQYYRNRKEENRIGEGTRLEYGPR